MPEIIDLSQEIYHNMPVHKSMPEVKVNIHATHEQWDNLNTKTSTPSAYKIELGEHTGTHVDAINHMGKEFEGQSIDNMPLSMFYTMGVCLDLSHKMPGELITEEDLKNAISKIKEEILVGETVLLYTNHYRNTYNTPLWASGPGLSAGAAIWLGQMGIVSFGVETVSPGIPGVSNRQVHQICGDMGFTHYENLINLHLLIGRGKFRFIGLPLKIRGGTGSPVRAIAIFE